MDMVSDSGAITDVNEIAAALGLTPEEIRAEDEAIMASSLEDLLEDLSTAEYVTDAADEELTDSDVNPALESLSRVVQGIINSGGISRNDAHALKTMTASMEGFEHVFDNTPMNSFTEIPSKVNFQPTMEGILSNIGRKIIEFVRAIVRWIREKASSFVNWLRGVRTNVKKTDEAAKKTNEQLKKSEAAMTAVDLRALMTAAAEQGRTAAKQTFEESRKTDIHLDEVTERIKKTQEKIDAFFGGKPAPNWTSGATERVASDSKRQIDIPSILYNAKETEKLSPAALSYAFSSVVSSLNFHLIYGSDYDNGTDRISAKGIITLAKVAEMDVSGMNDLMNTRGFTDTIRSVASEYNKISNNVDVVIVDNPERVMREFIEYVQECNLARISDKEISKMNSLALDCKKVSEETEKDIAKNPPTEDNDPRVRKVEWVRRVTQAANDVATIYAHFAKAYNQLTIEGAMLSNNPARARAA